MATKADDSKHFDMEMKNRGSADNIWEGIVDVAAEYSDAYYRKLIWKTVLQLLLIWVCNSIQQADKTLLSI